jgi:hypothetical protein
MLEEQLLAKISEVIPIIRKNNDVKNLHKAVFSSSRKKGLVIALDFPEKQKLDAPAKYLLGIKEIREKYSEEYIENILLDCYDAFLSDEQTLNSYIKKIVDDLLESKIKDYLVISELENIELIDDQEYGLVDSVIKILKKEDIPFDADIIKVPGTDILSKPVIITQVMAGEKEKAKEIALHYFLVSLNLIRLYVPSFKPVLKGRLHSSIQSLIVHDNIEKSVSVDTRRVGDTILKRAKLSSELYNKMLESGIAELKKENAISKVVKECLYWYGLGLDESYPVAKLIDFVTVLESALKKKSETTELRRAVSERGAVLLNDSFADRKKAFEDLKKIYDLRSKVVHTGAVIDNKDMASLAGGYARAVLLTLIEKSRAFNGNFEEFINHIDDIKLGKV